MRNYSESTTEWSLTEARDYLLPALHALDSKMDMLVNFTGDYLELRDGTGRREVLFTREEILDGTFKGKLMDKVMKFRGDGK